LLFSVIGNVCPFVRRALARGQSTDGSRQRTANTPRRECSGEAARLHGANDRHGPAMAGQSTGGRGSRLRCGGRNRHDQRVSLPGLTKGHTRARPGTALLHRSNADANRASVPRNALVFACRSSQTRAGSASLARPRSCSITVPTSWAIRELGNSRMIRSPRSIARRHCLSCTADLN
jgi:hypothetical protein